MQSVTPEQVEAMSGPELVAAYNALGPPKAVKGGPYREIGARQVLEALEAEGGARASNWIPPSQPRGDRRPDGVQVLFLTGLIASFLHFTARPPAVDRTHRVGMRLTPPLHPPAARGLEIQRAALDRRRDEVTMLLP